MTERLQMSATAIHQHMGMGDVVRIVWQESIWRVICADSLQSDRFAMVLRNRDGEMQTVEMAHIQQVFAEVSEHAIR